MKRIIQASAVVAIAGALSGCVTSSYASDRSAGSGGAVTVGAFHEALGGHGEWVNHGAYGSVWRPNVAEVGVGFRPYATGGRWLYSDVGWAWQSDWDWGWAPFHYGRWILDDAYGWVWVPDTVWGPAWVSWRYGGGLVGWAPLAPVGFVEIDTYHPYWCFVGHNYLLEPNVYHYASAVDYHQAFAVTTRVNATVTINGSTRVWAGPPVGQISQATGHTITPVTIGAPAPGVIQPHTLNGIAAPQVARSGGVIPGHVSPNGLGQPVGHTGVVPGSPAQAPGGVRPASGTTVGGIPANRPLPNQPGASPARPTYATPMQPGGVRPTYAAPNPYGYGYHAQPAQRSAPTQTYRPPAQPTYRPASPSYRPAAPVSRPSAPAAVHSGKR